MTGTVQCRLGYRWSSQEPCIPANNTFATSRWHMAMAMAAAHLPNPDQTLPPSFPSAQGKGADVTVPQDLIDRGIVKHHSFLPFQVRVNFGGGVVVTQAAAWEAGGGPTTGLQGRSVGHERGQPSDCDWVSTTRVAGPIHPCLHTPPPRRARSITRSCTGAWPSCRHSARTNTTLTEPPRPSGQR